MSTLARCCWGAAFALMLLPVAFSADPDPPPMESCEACHTDLVAGWEATAHGRLRDFEMHGGERGCTSCHGDPSAHLDSADPEAIRGLGATVSQDAIAEVCTSCHRSESLHDWNGSAHALADVGCTDCHGVHEPVGYDRGDPDRCVQCHGDVRAQFQYPSHHPLREKHMNCSSCHTPHGSSVSLLKTDERPEELCLGCHSQFQGPYIFEHEPVSEGCDTCHAPHGAVANNLLRQNEPFLCLQCHEMHFHAGLEGEEEDEVYIPRYDPLQGASDGLTFPGGMVPNPWRGAGYKRAFVTKCTQCHTAIHGTDLPSQTVPQSGSGLMR